LVDEGRPVAEVASNLGIHVNTLHGWRQQFSDDPSSAFPGNGKSLGKDEEIRQNPNPETGPLRWACQGG
jgi:transposase-like protein